MPAIRLATDEDVDAIADMQARSIMTLGAKAYGRDVCEAWARMGRQVRHSLLDSGTFFVAEQVGRVVAVAGWTEDSREPDCAWARYVFVAPEVAGHGLGRRLMTTVERSVTAAGRRRLQLWASLNAVGFYEKLGYRRGKPALWPIGGGIEMKHFLMDKTLPGTRQS